MNILIASGGFKDVYTPKEACLMIKEVIESINLDDIDLDIVPMVDGGEYSLDVLHAQDIGDYILLDNVINP